MEYTPNIIWQLRQNHPELVVQDCKKEFNFSEEQCEVLRKILMFRGVNKWLYGRLLFIDLKHDIKNLLKNTPVKTPEYKLLQYINTRMQRIAKMPRWIEWGKHAYKNMKNNRKEIVIKGHSC